LDWELLFEKLLEGKDEVLQRILVESTLWGFSQENGFFGHIGGICRGLEIFN